MASPLPRNMTVPLGKDELASSFASRTAMVNGRTARQFCLDMGFRFQDVVDGKSDALTRLASCGRADPSHFRAIRRIDDRLFELGGERLHRTGLARGRVRACLACLNDDISRFACPLPARPYQRLEWSLTHIRTCRHHRLALVELANDLNPQTVHDFSLSLHGTLPQLGNSQHLAINRGVSSLEEYLLGRLTHLPAAKTWLDGFRFDAVGKMCEMLGAAYDFGVRVRVSDLTDDQLYQCGDRGYSYACRGESGVRELLSELQGRLDPTKPGQGPKMAFYRIYEWLAHESDDAEYDRLREVFATHCIETMPLGSGDELFGKPVEVRKLHSIRTASLTYQTHPKRLRKLLYMGRYLSEEANKKVDDHALFDADAAHSFIERAIQSLNFKEAMAYLNVPRPHEKTVLGGSYIEPLVDVTRGERQPLVQYAYEKSALDEFLERLLGHAAPWTTDERQFIGILDARKRACCALSEILDLLLSRKLCVRKNPEERGFLSVMVNLAQLRAAVQLKDHNAISLKKAEKALRVNTRVLTALLSQGHIRSRIEVNPINRCPQTVIDHADIERFQKTYVSLFTLAKETGIHFNNLKKQLSDVPLAMDRGLIGSTFYLRSDLPSL
ncbi:TniQ family protein [Mycoplana dimorpha]|uniref:TniQ protein n=1 Tax=Mycoplana dimorpha TaxID=28320 RepID=A0A2T5BJ76_MYCDI|nr:TniQ family protein [Mycoplana dimorpha]PTM99044.1 TniQ protein [Mycoplana dimorpha]